MNSGVNCHLLSCNGNQKFIPYHRYMQMPQRRIGILGHDLRSPFPELVMKLLLLRLHMTLR